MNTIHTPQTAPHRTIAARARHLAYRLPGVRFAQELADTRAEIDEYRADTGYEYTARDVLREVLVGRGHLWLAFHIDPRRNTEDGLDFWTGEFLYADTARRRIPRALQRANGGAS